MKTTKDLKAGDVVYVARMGSWDIRYVKGTVAKVTPAGMVDVKIGGSEKATRFRADLHEQGADDKYRSYYLDLDDAKVERILADRRARQEETDCLTKVKHYALNMRASMADAVELETLVADLKAKLAGNDRGD